MDRRNNISPNGSTAAMNSMNPINATNVTNPMNPMNPKTGFTRFTLYASLFTVFMLLYALQSSSFAADKLIVKDSGGSTNVFVVDDTGTITASGNLKWDSTNYRLGLGTLTPNVAIHAKGNWYDKSQTIMHFDQTNSNGGGGYIAYHNNNGALPVANDRLGYFLFGSMDGSTPKNAAGLTARAEENWSSSAAGSYFAFETTTPGTLTRLERLRITGSGNVGIGTTDPQGKLDVNGSIYQRGTQLYSDYVFEKDYKIESIEDHARYMWTNKHLSAVPGVRKDENGQEIVEVGAHQRGILEELEKAHVYIEQLSKKIKALEAKLKSLEETNK